jgi:hypothetical protein
VIAAIAAGLILRRASRPLNDIDVLWHVQLGRQIIDLHRVGDLPTWWLGVSEPHGWVTSQWLAEVLQSAVVENFGLIGLVAVRILLTIALLIGIWVSVLRRRPPTLAVPVFVLAVAAVHGSIQDRPQAISLVLLPWLGLACLRIWTSDRRPPLIWLALGCLVWAQLHGLWILAPIAFALVAGGVAADHRGRPSHRGRSALLCLGVSMIGVVNPHGLGSFLLPFRFQASTTAIAEWRATTFSVAFVLCWGVLVLLLLVAWSRSDVRIPRVELVWALAWTGFGLQSYRNVAPAVLLTAPVVVIAMQRAWGKGEARRNRPAGLLESRVLAGACTACLLTGALAAGTHLRDIDPLQETPGRRAAEWISRQSGPVRVFNTYDSAGGLIQSSAGKARLVVDGRADLWGARYIQRIQDTEGALPGWRATLRRFHPDVVLVPRRSGLAAALTDQGWETVLRDRDLVLLRSAPRDPTGAA